MQKFRDTRTARELREYRYTYHISQQQLCESFGVDRTTLIRWEQGNCQRQSKLIHLALSYLTFQRNSLPVPLKENVAFCNILV